MSADFDTPRGPINRHRFIVRHPSRAGVIAVDGRALPRVDTDDQHTADVEHLIDAIAARYGVETTVLRSLIHGEVVAGAVERAHELELRGDVSTGRFAWTSAATFVPVDDADRIAFDAWRAPATANARRDWMAIGWFDRACRWIETALVNAGYTAPLSIRQIRCWMSSCVLRVECGATIAYFKALPAGSAEFAVTRWLAAEFPDHVAPLIASDRTRRWLLLGACAGRNLETVANIEAWTAAARRYGELQVECASRVDALRRTGCGDRALAALPAAVAELAADAAVLQPVGHDGATKVAGALTDVELARLRGAVPMLAARCAELASLGIADALEHGDLWPGNVFVAAGASAIIDWEDAAIAHPFLSLAPLTVGLGNCGLATAANVERLERAYAGAFESSVPADRLRRALDLAAPLCFFDMAVRYRAQRASVVRLHPWMRDLVPQTVRLALARL